MTPDVSPIRRLMRAGRMQQLAWFRTLSLALQVTAVTVAVVLMPGAWPLPEVLTLLGLNLLLLAVVWWRRRSTRQGNDTEVFGHLFADQVGLFLLIALTGGAANPFVMLLLLPLALAAVLLPGRYVLVLLVTVVLGYLSLLTWPELGARLVLSGAQQGELVMHFRQGAHAGHDGGDAYGTHLRGMWVAFALAALLMSFFIYWIASALRYRETALRRLQVQRLRDEKLLALGAQAATAAHELGSPLSTARLLCEELAEAPLDDSQRQLLEDIHTEIKRSGALLRKLAEVAHRRRGEQLKVADMQSWLREQVERWRALYPGVAPSLEIDSSLEGETLNFDEGIADALANLLSNAADASPQAVAIEARLRSDGVLIDVLDRGPGYRPAPDAGTAPSDEGLGMGVMLATALVERAGGQLSYLPRDGGGTIARLLLPLNRVVTR